MSAEVQIFTIGHSSHPLDDFLDLLQQHEIRAVVDVRRYPGSKRHPHFSRKSLSESLEYQGVLWQPSDGHAARKWSDRALKNRPSGHNVRDGRTAEVSVERGGTTPFNLLPIPNVDTRAADDHPATTPYDLAAWWCRYLLPSDGVLCDPFCGSGTMLQAGLDIGASKVIGIDKVKEYLATAKRRVNNS